MITGKDQNQAGIQVRQIIEDPKTGFQTNTIFDSSLRF